ncbi:hypothetical protein, partial [Streptomyces sp. NRRL F-5053]|uniref:hypothetical protein n=1 Tax=Streptomyces sp. NRRL F-5053 TaxID=1463854 RepID=UPI0013317FA1
MATVWWWKLPKAEDEELTLPPKVCGDSLAGSEVKSVFQGASGDLNEHANPKFPREGGGGSPGAFCELSADGTKVGFRVQGPSWGKTRAELAKSHEQVTELGPAHGGYRKTGGVMTLYLPCPTKKIPEAELFVTVESDIADPEYAPSKELKQGIIKLAHLTGYTARTLAHKYQCEGADELPDGPVQLR